MSIEKWGQNRQYNANSPRHRLAEVVPLSAPFLVHIDPTNKCNFRCRFCPTGQPELLEQVQRPAGFMDCSLFEKIIGDMQSFPKRPKVLHLYKDGEPLLHPHFGDLAKLAVQSNVAEQVNVTTNGSILSERKSREILDAGIDIVRVSIEHVHSAGYRDRTQTFDNYQAIVGNVARFYELRNQRGSNTKIWVKILQLGLNEQEIAKFDQDFAKICDECLMMTPMGWSRTDLYDFTLGTKPTTGDNGETPLQTNRVVCPYPFYSLAINFDGSVSICCADWSHGTIIGDVRKQSLASIWNGNSMQEFRRLHLLGTRSKISACANCQSMQGLPMDSDLDAERLELLSHFPISQQG